MQQLFENLLNNAIKYNDKEKGEIHVNFTDKETHWQFEVADNGMGISKKYFEKIFQIFQALTNADDATGIGLSIVKKIVGLYGGEVWVTSELGKGSKFYFTLENT